MSFTGRPRVPSTPTLPQGETVASYGTYLEAQRAVDHLSDKQFPVQLVTIVGTDLRMVERVTGRLSYGRVAVTGFGSGAWFGVFVGLLFMLTSSNTGILFTAVLIGGAFGLLLSVILYSLTGGKRDFTSQSQIVAAQYAVLCQREKANEARGLLAEVGGVRDGLGGPARPVPPVVVGRPSDPSATYPQPTPGTGAVPPAPGQPGQPAQPPAQPRYGQLAPQPGTAQPGAAQPGTAQPGTAQSGTVQPDAAQPPAAPAQDAPPAEPRYGQLRPPTDPS
jgi:hypothetical protein